jgi:uncharacterized membrane protein YciS (DUF1049 family)
VYKFLSNKWILIILGTVQIALLSLDYYIHPIPFFHPLSITLLTFFVFVLGMIASHHQEKIVELVKKLKKALMVIIFLLAFYIFFEARTNYLKSFNYLFVYSHWRPSILLYTVSLAGLLFFFFGKIKNFKLTKNLSRLSFFVFFVHIIFLEIIWNKIGIRLFNPINPNIGLQFLFDIAFFSVVSFLSFLTAYIIHKIPYLEKIFG